MDTTTVKQDYTKLNLDQLKALRAQWLEAGVKIAPALRKIVETLGVPQPDPTHRRPKTYAGICGKGWQAYLYETVESRDTAQNRWNVYGMLWLEVGNDTPVRIRYQNEKIVMDSDTVFVPGHWTDELLALEADADALIEQRSNQIELSELDNLRKLMGVGTLI